MRTSGTLRMGCRLAFLATLVPGDALAQEQAMLHVRSGQAVAEHIESWRAPCADFVLTENEDAENYLTCVMDGKQAVTANVNARGVVWWSRFWGAGGLDRTAFVDRQRAELGMSGEGQSCSYFDRPAECWQTEAGEVMIPQEQEMGQWVVTMEDSTLRPPE